MMMDRFDVIKENDTCRSGLACLAMICRYYGRAIDLTGRPPMAVSVGESLQEIAYNAEKLGFSSITGHLLLTKLSKVTLPCLLYWDNEYYVVLCKVKRGTYYVADPTKGLIKCSETDIKRHWINPQITNDEKGVAVFIKATDEFYKQAKEYNQLIKQNSVWRHVKRLLLWWK